jgi:hypothetical protein
MIKSTLPYNQLAGTPKPPTLFSTQQAAEILHVSRRTLEKWRVTGDGPAYLKIGRLCFYAEPGINHWLGTRVRRSTSDRGNSTCNPL